MISCAQNLVEYFHHSRQFYYLILDRQGNLSYANPLFKETFNHSWPDLTITSLGFSVPDQQKFLRAIQECITNPSAVVARDTEIESLDGTRMSISWEFTATVEQGLPEAIRAIGVPRRLQDHCLPNESFGESKQSFLHIVNNPRFGVVMRNASGKPVFYNKTALDFSGLSDDEFLKTTLPVKNVLVTQEDGSSLPDRLHPTVIATREKIPVKDSVLKVFKKNTNEWRWILTSAEPVKDNKGELQHVITTFIDITERKIFEQKLMESEINRQRAINRATIEGQEKERKGISSELHDNIGQLLTTTQLYLEIAKTTADEKTLEMIQLSSKSILHVIRETRKLSRSLTPPALGDLGLVESIKDLCDTIRTTQAFTIRFYHRDFKEGFLQEDIKLTLFRIIQEQLSNIIKYADAMAVLIRLVTDRRQLMLAVSDNGKGFDPLTVKKGLGLNNIINRADLFNGRARINSAPGQGSTIIVTLPFQ